MKHVETDILIVGGGPAGICAALGAANHSETPGRKKRRITLLESNARLGKKILISGGGKCNITHEGEVEKILKNGFLRPSDQRFLKPAMYEFSNQDVLDLLGRYGLKTQTCPDGCIFPSTNQSHDVLLCFEEALRSCKSIQVELGQTVTALKKTADGFMVLTPAQTFLAQRLVLSTGGVSYPKTGSKGDGLNYAMHFGHQVMAPTAALSPIDLSRLPHPSLIGISCRNVMLEAQHSKKPVSRQGDVLFSHKGLTGPGALSLSTVLGRWNAKPSSIKLFMDFLPAISSEALNSKFIELSKSKPHQHFKSLLKDLAYLAPAQVSADPAYPEALVPFMLSSANLPENKPLSQLKKSERQALLNCLKAYPLGNVKSLPIEKGEISAGGVLLKEINPKTMESRLMEGLYFCGEVLDYAGEIGGYNFQAAYSTGWLAGKNAVKSLS